MELQFMLTARTFRNEILKEFESTLDPQLLRLIRENDEAYKSFQSLFMQLKGTTSSRVELINQVIEYIRQQYE